MRTQVSFTTDEELKNKALKKAKSQGISLKTLLVYAMKSFVEGKIGLSLEPLEEPEIEEMHFDDKAINAKAKKLARLLG